MRRYLLDTALIAGFLNNRLAAVELISPWIRRREAATSILVYGEVVEYLKGLSDFERRLVQRRGLLREVYPYVLTFPMPNRYADIRRSLRPPYGPGLIGDVDTLIAATALESTLFVVTTDQDYERVPDLQVMRVSLKTAR